MEPLSPVHTNRIGKRGAWVVPASLRHRYGLDEGTLVIAEPRPDGILLKPAIASAKLPDASRQENVWQQWFHLMGEVRATAEEIAEAKSDGCR